MRRRADVGCALLFLAACATPPQRGAESAPSRDADAPSDTVHLTRLEREARAIAKTEGCTSTSACRTAPVGWRSCGGPRTYIAYCAATTDSVALFRKLDELKAAETAYNEKAGMVSTCEMRLPPAITVQGSRCMASR